MEEFGQDHAERTASKKPWTGRRRAFAFLGALLLFAVGFDLLERQFTSGDESVLDSPGSVRQVESLRPEILGVLDGVVQIELGGPGGPRIDVEVQDTDIDRLITCLEEGFDRTLKARRQDAQVDFLLRRMKRRPMAAEVQLIHRRCLDRLTDQTQTTD